MNFCTLTLELTQMQTHTCHIWAVKRHFQFARCGVHTAASALPKFFISWHVPGAFLAVGVLVS